MDPNQFRQQPLVLLIDLGRETQELIEAAMAEIGCTFISIPADSSVLQRYHSSSPDLILFDLNTNPVVNIGLCGELRQQDSDIPLLALVDQEDHDLIDQALDIGVSDCVTSPIDSKLLLRRLRFVMHLRSMDLELSQSQRLLTEVQRIAKLGYWEIDLLSHQVTWTDQVYEICGADKEEFDGTLDGMLQFIHPEDNRGFKQAVIAATEKGKSLAMEHRVVHSGGGARHVQERADVVTDDHDQPVKLAGYMQDITGRKHTQDFIQFQAYHDGLTGLPNRRMFQDRLKNACHVSAQKSMLAVLYIGLDRFKRINSSLGHELGDRVILLVGERLSNLITDRDTLARVGGDEFAIILVNRSKVAELGQLVLSVLTRLTEPFSLEGQELFLSASIGVTVYPLDDTKPDNLMRNACSAMDRVKAEGGGHYQFFTSDMNAQASQRLSLEGFLRRALERDEFQLFYQPQVSTRDRSIVGFEVLLRWNHPKLGLMTPGHFITITEETGLILNIGYWVMHHACMQVKKWDELGLPPVRIGVNLSPRQFTNPGLVGDVKKVLTDIKIEPSRLDLEITESMAMDDMKGAITILRGLKDLGVELSIDDFGTGHSSLSYLQDMPVDTLKLDRAFISDYEDIGEERILVSGIAAMAKSLNLRMIVEGVENEAQFQLLQRINCEEAQGYLFGKPASAEQAEFWLRHGV